MKTLKDFSDDELDAFIRKEHGENKVSLRELARRLETYAVKLVRFCQKRNIPTLSIGESLKAGYDSNRIKKHGVGKKLDKTIKDKMGVSARKRWSKMSEEERALSREKGKLIYERKTDHEKANFAKAGSRAIYQASKTGSKAELALASLFSQYNIPYIARYKHLFQDTKLEVDFFLPDHNTIVEIDGPSHFRSNLGVDNLAAQQQADAKKNSRILEMGASIIRVRHDRKLYSIDYQYIFNSIMDMLPTLHNELRTINVN